MVEQGVRAIVEAIVAGAPGGWTEAVFHSEAGRQGTSVSGGYLPRGKRRHSPPNPYKELMALAETLRHERGWERVSLEIRCRPSGAYRFVAFDNAVARVTGRGFQAVLDNDYRLPQPGMDQEPATAAPAGDAELAVARFHAYLKRRAEILGHPEELPPPAPPEPLHRRRPDTGTRTARGGPARHPRRR